MVNRNAIKLLTGRSVHGLGRGNVTEPLTIKVNGDIHAGYYQQNVLGSS